MKRGWMRTAGIALAVMTLGLAASTAAVAQETEADLYLNTTAAKAMGVEIPPELLEEAVEIYE